MNGFQLVSISIAAAFCVIVVAGLLKHRITLGSALFWLAIWIGAATAIFRPELTRILAQSLGIARGADLVFYFAILAMFIGFFLIYSKLRRLDHKLTQVVRQVAIETGSSDGDTRTTSDGAAR